jgi:TP901 family phage tail tape measure protein
VSGRPVRISILANGRQARAELQSTGLAATGLGRTVAGVAKGMGLAFAGIEIAHLGGELIHQAVQFQSATNLLVTAGGESRKAIGLVSDGILKLAGETGTSTEQLAEGMYTVEKAGFRAANGLIVLKNAAEGAKAENVDLATMTSAVTSVMTSYHKKASESAQVVNELVAASGAAKTTMQLFAGSLASVLPTASAAGISFAEVGAAIATLTQHGTSADEATQELANTIRNLQAPNSVASHEMQQLGINVTNLSKNLGKRGLTGTLDLVVNAIGKSMGKSGLVMINAFRKSQSAGADLQTMVKSMPKNLADLSRGFLTGSVSMDDYRKGIKKMGADNAAMGTQFLSLVKSSKGFSEALKSGNPTAQTFTATLKKVLGGATGMNTALQLTGENMAGFKSRVEEIDSAAKGNQKTVSTWAATQKTAAVQIDKLKFSLQALGIKGATALLPLLTKGLVPLTDWLDKNESSFERFGSHLVNDFKPVGAVVATLAKGFGVLPGPIKSVGLEVALLSRLMPRLTASTLSATGSITAQAGSLRMWGSALASAETRSTALGLAGLKLASAAKTLAGPAGILALSASANTTNKALGALERIGGGAALGFSMGGPWGAAIGGLVGGLISLKGMFGKTADAAQEAARRAAASESWAAAKQAVQDLTDALHGTVKAYNDVTAAAVQKGFRNANGQLEPWVKQLMDAGVSMDTLTRATLGQRDAQKLLTQAQGQVGSNLLFRKGQLDQAVQELASNKAKLAALNNQISTGSGATNGPSLSAQKAEQDRLTSAIAAGEKTVNSARNAYKDYASTVDSGNRALGALGNTVLQQNALERQRRAELGLTKKAYDALPKDVRIKVETQGAPQTKTELLDFIKTAKLTPKQVVTVVKALGIPVTRKDLEGVGVAVDKIPKSAFTKVGVIGGPAAVGQAHAFGASAGSSFGAGYVGGIAAWAGRAAFAAAAIANAAHAAAMRAQRSNSPSKKMIQVGKWFTQGFAIGIRSDAQKVLDAVDTLYDKLNKKQLPGIKKIVRQYEKGAHGLQAIAKQQSALSDKIKDATQSVTDAKQAWQDYYNTVKTAVVAFGDITQLGKNSAGNATTDGIIKGLQARRDAVLQYVADIQQLKKDNLNNTALQQIIDAGVDGGLQTANAILAGGAGTIQSINALQGQIDTAASQLGTSMANNFKLAGVQAAQGLLNGLLADQKGLDAVARRLADALVKAVKHRLGIKSPSTVFKEIGLNTIAGLNIGLDSAPVHRVGEVLASDLIRGFGTPTLTASAVTPGLLAAQAQAQALQSLQLTVTLSAPQRDALLQGRDVQLDISAATSSGARQLA